MKKIKFNFDNIDKATYIRDGDSKRLIHRDVAFKEIYRKDRKKYPLPFRMYQVHHIDGNKLNNSSKNLLVLTREEHKRLHNITVDKLLQRDVDKIMENLDKMSESELNRMFEKVRKTGNE